MTGSDSRVAPLLPSDTESRLGSLLPSGSLLRIATAGSVDDGKSTLIGRLLYDSKAVMEDQLAAVERTSRERGNDYTDLALVTDGLRSEREQGITIDVAYRYFATPKRKFIIADTPGHIQYTRNMVTGTSTAQLVIVLVDARHGLLEQSRRHAFLASLLGVQHVVLAVNKMDLIDWDQERFEWIRDEFHAFAARLDIHDVTTIPMSALNGDNVVTKSDKAPWYDGPATAEPPRGRLHRRRPQPRRRALPGAVRDPAADRRARRPSQLRGHRRQRRAASGRRDRRSAKRKDQPHHRDRRSDRPGGRGVPADGGVDQPRRRHRHLPRRHAGASAEPADRHQ